MPEDGLFRGFRTAATRFCLLRLYSIAQCECDMPRPYSCVRNGIELKASDAADEGFIRTEFAAILRDKITDSFYTADSGLSTQC